MCICLNQAYSSNLTSYLTTPMTSPAMDTVAQVVKGDLPWRVVLYGNKEENIVAAIQDPAYQKFWREKVPLYEYDFNVRGQPIKYSSGRMIHSRLDFCNDSWTTCSTARPSA